MKSAISVFSYLDGKEASACYYLNQKEEKKTRCFFTPISQCHIWITEDGKLPDAEERCLCGRSKYHKKG